MRFTKQFAAVVTRMSAVGLTLSVVAALPVRGSASAPVLVTRWSELLADTAPASIALPVLQGHTAVAELEKQGLYGSLQQALEAARYRIYRERHQAVAWPLTIVPPFTQQQKLLASDAAAFDTFGDAVAISGETVVVGAPGAAGAAGGGQGAAYIFVRSGGVWSEQQKLETSDASAVFFGESVAISGDTVVVGTPFERAGVDPREGAAYVFVRSGGVWSQQQKLEASDGFTGNRFGWVAISGETIVVGAPGETGPAGFSRGAAYVFVRSGSVWTEHQKLFGSDAAAGDHFGISVAISGETFVVGAPFDILQTAPGSAYVFVRTGGVWSEQQKLLASDAAAGDLFGSSLAISGETVVVGVGSSFVGIPASLQGSAYVFVRSGGVWSQQQKLLASDTAEFDEFGFSVAISGETVVVGAPGHDDTAGSSQGSAYVFAPDTPPTITLKAPISLWPPNHTYRTLTVSQMVQSASDPEDGNLTNAVVIEKVTSDEPDDAPGRSDGNTTNDISIAGTCTSVDLRAERDETKNGRVYSVTLRLTDSAGNITRAVFKVSVPRDQIGLPAIEDAPALTVTSNCS